MRFILITLISFFFFDSYSQDAVDYVVLLLIKEGVVQNKLPTELINNYDSIGYPKKVVVLQNTNENGLNSGAYTQFNDVDYAIWTAEELFTRDPYWMIPGKIKRKGNSITFKFTDEANFTES